MIVITLTDCPVSLRGDLSKWLVEINTGVFVGKVSARVRDQLWKRVKDNVKNGRATMVYSTNNEQHMDFRIHNSQYQIIDFDGLKLVMKPSMSRTKHLEKRRRFISKAAQMRIGQKRKNSTSTEEKAGREEALYPSDYIVLDLETSGLREKVDEIIEIGMLKVSNGSIVDSFQTLLKNKKPLPPPIEKLTGITQEMLNQSGRQLGDIIPQIKMFIGNHCIVGHNIVFDMKFLNTALERNGVEKIINAQYDTMKICADKVKRGGSRKSLADVVNVLEIEDKPCHRAINDCRAVMAVYEKLRAGRC